MQKMLILFLLIVGPVACATPTSAPTQPPLPVSSSLPAPTRTIGAARSPVPGAPGIAVQNPQTQKQADGNLVTTAKVTAAENLGLGQIDLAYPETLQMGESRTIRLKLSPAQQLASMTPVAVPAKTPDLPSFVYKFGGNIDLYPVMMAELRAIKFDVKPAGVQRRTVDPTKEAIWDWVVSPTMTGHQDLSLELSVPAIVNGVATDLSTEVIKNLVFNIDVQNPPPPSLWTRIVDSLAGNAGPLLVALIGLLGTLIGIIAKIQSDKSKAKASKK